MPTAARTRQQDPNAGYVMYFPDELYSMVARDLVERKVKLVTNVGAVNPHACAAAMQETARSAARGDTHKSKFFIFTTSKRTGSKCY